MATLLAAALVAATHVGAPGAPARQQPVGPPAASRAQPNIVVVMADDMRVDDLLFMPSLRRLVGAHGLTFQNSFSPYPLCCPARASFLTGSHAHNHEVYWHQAPYGYGAFDDSRSLATSLSGAGYTTGFVGKYLNRYGPARSLVSGARSYSYVPRGWSDWRASIDATPGVGIHGSTYHYFDTPFNINGRVDNSHRGDYSSQVIGGFSVDMARDFARRDRPFFLYVNYVAPHFGGPREADDPPRFLRDRAGATQDLRTPARPAWVRGRFDRLVDRAAGLPRGGGPSETDVSDKPRAFRVPEPTPRERAAMRTLTRQRAESIFVMDTQVRRLIAELKQSGEWAATVFAFTSDNGYYLGEHRRRSGKVRAHEPSLRVPLLVTGPGMRAGADRYDPITTIDLSASILDLAGARPPRRTDGVSRVRTMRHGDVGWTTAVLNEATHTDGAGRRAPGFSDPRTSIGVRTARYSYIRARSGEDELYDLLRDPLQQRNVHGRPGYATVERALLRAWWQLKDCAGSACQEPLPAELQVTAAHQATLTRAYWSRVREVYGFRA